ncbi:Conserved_hypothetical protein [Hexamita inflata]|uniref:Uncharacterized protein n=1 Tax=Hexamita inflata TaxID=28002 RepID=A0AA86PAF1_9EUKA|nr:Conserved hypothetical protein [Hexamita inflata]
MGSTHSVISQSQMMNCFSIFNDLYIYVVISSNKLLICNLNQEVLFQKRIQFNIYEQNQKDKQEQLILKAYLYQPVISKGQIYFMCENKIFKLQNNNIENVGSFPVITEQTIPPDNYICQFFSYNDDLYVSNLMGVIYLVEDGKLHYVSKFKGQFYQYCNTVLCFSNSDGYIYQLVDQFKFEKLFVVGDFWQLIFCGGGLLIGLVNKYYIIIDILNKNIAYRTQDQVYSKLNITQILELSHSGLCLSRSQQSTFMSSDKIFQLENEYFKFIQRQMSTFRSYSDEMCKLINNFDTELASKYSQQFVSLQYNSQSNILHFAKQKYKTRLFTYLDLYLVFDDYSISIINENNIILIQYDQFISPFIQNKTKQYQNTFCMKESKFNPEYFKSVYCNSELYFQIVDSVFVLRGHQLVFVASIPVLSMNWSGSVCFKLFCIENELFAMNGNREVYQLCTGQCETGFVFQNVNVNWPQVADGFAFMVEKKAYLLNRDEIFQITFNTDEKQIHFKQMNLQANGASVDDIQAAFEFARDKLGMLPELCANPHISNQLVDFDAQLNYVKGRFVKKISEIELKMNYKKQIGEIDNQIQLINGQIIQITNMFPNIICVSEQ